MYFPGRASGTVSRRAMLLNTKVRFCAVLARSEIASFEKREITDVLLSVV